MLVVFAACGEPPEIVVEPLQVLSWVPNRGAQCVAARAGELVAAVTFSDDIDFDSLNADTLFVRQEGGTAVASQIAYDKASQTAHLTVIVDLDLGAVHELVATDEIRGVSRGHLATELHSAFATISPAGCF
ncbi:MAG: hypothetical protein A2289_20795 [Deltaproteobacteria bacterium RIFOXYA12_FULL_58_15]|nr:MAG: hypothetical protein A2289_20795 [Deltaproteobacteria bacterium RIFOXYA12_FULL_58_15]